MVAELYERLADDLRLMEDIGWASEADQESVGLTMPRLHWSTWHMASASHCLHEWVEPDDEAPGWGRKQDSCPSLASNCSR